MITSSKKPGQADTMEIRALTARATNAERRIINLQNQLLQSEERVLSMNQKTTAADTKWEARVKEYETRIKQAEEKVKRERQGGKERILELDTQARYAIQYGPEVVIPSRCLMIRFTQELSTTNRSRSKTHPTAQRHARSRRRSAQEPVARAIGMTL